jgi:hypothetical protein
MWSHKHQKNRKFTVQQMQKSKLQDSGTLHLPFLFKNVSTSHKSFTAKNFGPYFFYSASRSARSFFSMCGEM